MGDCQVDRRYEVIGWQKGERSVEQDNPQCSLEHGNHAFEWKPVTSEVLLAVSFTRWCGGLEKSGLGAGSSVGE